MSSGSTARGAIITQDYDHWKTFSSSQAAVLALADAVGVSGGVINVPAGQAQLVIRLRDVITNPDPWLHYCRPRLYVTRGHPMSVTYDSNTSFVFSFASPGLYQSEKWEGAEIIIPSPAPGPYYFLVWQATDNLTDPNRPCAREYTVTTEYFPLPPSISRITPAQQEKDLGTMAAIVVSGSGQNPFYRWEKRKNGSTTRVSSSLNASAATATLSLANLAGADDAEYRAVVCNAGGCSTSAWSRLIVRLPPTIATQPQPRKVMPGNSATFSVTATGAAPLTYQWQQRDLEGNVRNLSGANSSGLTLNNAAYPARAGAYRVLVMNAANPAGLGSAWATLTIGPDILNLSPANASVTEGNPVTITASANGTAPLVYNWFRDGQLRQSGGSVKLSLASTREQDDGSWRLDVTNLAGKASQTFTLDVIPPPTPPSFLVNPANAVLTEGETLTLTSRAFGTRPITYQWFHDGNPAGSGATLEIPSVGPQHAGQWKVRASNSLGSDDSSVVTVTVSTGPKIVRQPGAQLVVPGDAVAFSVQAVGRGPLTYRWFKNGQPLDATGTELLITNATGADAGYYSVQVTNALNNSAASIPARLRVDASANRPLQILWHLPNIEDEFLSPQLINDDGNLIASSNKRIICISPEGTEIWSRPLPWTNSSGYAWGGK